MAGLELYMQRKCAKSTEMRDSVTIFHYSNCSDLDGYDNDILPSLNFPQIQYLIITKCGHIKKSFNCK